MNQILDVLIILTIKLVLIVGFVLAIRYWKRRRQMNNLPDIAYWLLGLFFVFMLSTQVIEWLLHALSDLSPLDSESIDSIGPILGLIVYIGIGRQNFMFKSKQS